MTTHPCILYQDALHICFQSDNLAAEMTISFGLAIVKDAMPVSLFCLDDHMRREILVMYLSTPHASCLLSAACFFLLLANQGAAHHANEYQLLNTA